MRGRDGASSFNSEELALLQECFDSILKSRSLVRTSPDADGIAIALFSAYQRGVTDIQELIRLVGMDGAAALQDRSRH